MWTYFVFCQIRFWTESDLFVLSAKCAFEYLVRFYNTLQEHVHGTVTKLYHCPGSEPPSTCILRMSLVVSASRTFVQTDGLVDALCSLVPSALLCVRFFVVGARNAALKTKMESHVHGSDIQRPMGENISAPRRSSFGLSS